MGAMPGYIYAQDPSGIYVNLFVSSTARIQLADRGIVLRQRTDYPWRGDIKITVEPAKPTAFDLHIRIPGWCGEISSSEDLYQLVNAPREDAFRVKVNGKTGDAKANNGYATLHRRWKAGDVVQVTLEMPVQRIKANPNVESDKGRVALMRGPIVYCFEGTDNGGAVQNLVIPAGANFEPEYKKDFLGGVTVLNGTATAVFRTSAKEVVNQPYQVRAVPYYANANRGTCPMQVWLPERQEDSKPQNQE